MLLYLTEYLAQFESGFNVFSYLTMRAILGALTALVLSPVLFADFIRLDDYSHLFDNPNLRRMSVAGLAAFWTKSYFNLYIPVTYSVWWAATMIGSLFGTLRQQAWLFHALNLAVHLANASLVFFLNTTRPPLDDAAVRQALLYGTDRQAIITALFHDATPVAYGPLAAITFAYDPQVQDYYAYDTGRAEELLDQASWTDSDGDRVRDRDGEQLAVDLYAMEWGHIPGWITALESTRSRSDDDWAPVLDSVDRSIVSSFRASRGTPEPVLEFHGKIDKAICATASNNINKVVWTTI